MEKDPPEDMIIYEDDDDKFIWHAVLFGLKNTIYEEAAFNVLIKFPEQYPFKPPKLIFENLVYHPNVDKDGNVCLPANEPDNWSPAIFVHKLLKSLMW